jgi:hypothetical protein
MLFSRVAHSPTTQSVADRDYRLCGFAMAW